MHLGMRAFGGADTRSLAMLLASLLLAFTLCNVVRSAGGSGGWRGGRRQLWPAVSCCFSCILTSGLAEKIRLQLRPVLLRDRK